MYCRNCGSEMADNAVVCVKCGVSKGAAAKYCPSCGSETNPDAAVCVKCGVALKKSSPGSTGVQSEKSKTTAGLFAIFLGHLGIHEFYLGNKNKAVIKIIATVISIILTIFGIGLLGILGIWAWNIYDAVMIFTGKRTDAQGNELK